MSLTINVIARDEEHRIGDCLRSVSWADERIVVVDDRTTDATAEVARALGARVEVRAFEGYSAQRRWAESISAGEWVMWIDADERASQALASEVSAVMSRKDAVAFRVPRLDFMFGRWIRHGGWYPQYHVRLFRRGCVRWEGLVHERAIPDGPLGTLREPVRHYAHHSVEEWVGKMTRYTSLEAEAMYATGERVGIVRLAIEPLAYGLYKLLWQRGFLDGTHGLALAGLMTCYRFLRNLRVWDLARLSKVANPEPR